jgi:hypothetical protein
MVSHSVDCFKCLASVWHATGRFNTSRRGLRRAELVCDACGYGFSSARPEAIAAAEAILQPEPARPIRGNARMVYVPPSRSGLTAAGPLAQDWKRKAAQESGE